MTEKWAVAFEYDLKQGVCILARKNSGNGDVALFNSKEDAEGWVNSSGEIDPEIFDINYIKLEV